MTPDLPLHTLLSVFGEGPVAPWEPVRRCGQGGTFDMDGTRSDLTLTATSRESGHARRDRAQGYVPVVMYGHGTDPRALRIEEHALLQLLQKRGSHHIMQLQIDGESEARQVVIKEIQRHPVTERIVHVDFQAVRAQEHIHTEVPIRIHGEDRLAKRGGILQLGAQEIRVSCLPRDLPDHVTVDVGDLNPGQVLTVRDLVVGSSITVLSEPDEVVLSVVAPRLSEGSASS